jgi:hypothetical protein
MSNTTELAEIKAAITAVLAGAQEVTIDGNRIVRPDLAVLRAMQSELEGKVGNETYGTRTYADWAGR